MWLEFSNFFDKKGADEKPDFSRSMNIYGESYRNRKIVDRKLLQEYDMAERQYERIQTKKVWREWISRYDDVFRLEDRYANRITQWEKMLAKIKKEKAKRESFFKSLDANNGQSTKNTIEQLQSKLKQKDLNPIEKMSIEKQIEQEKLRIDQPENMLQKSLKNDTIYQKLLDKEKVVEQHIVQQKEKLKALQENYRKDPHYQNYKNLIQKHSEAKKQLEEKYQKLLEDFETKQLPR